VEKVYKLNLGTIGAFFILTSGRESNSSKKSTNGWRLPCYFFLSHFDSVGQECDCEYDVSKIEWSDKLPVPNIGFKLGPVGM
jgi:hypothetical protein